MIQLYHK
jgi:hypothetical protein